MRSFRSYHKDSAALGELRKFRRSEKGTFIHPESYFNPRRAYQNIGNSQLKKYADLPPCQIVPQLADEGRYLASESTFYRVLKKDNQSSYRRKQKPPSHSKPLSFVATGPNQVWSWDISYLPTIVKGMFFYLYMYVDIFSRKIVGFGVHEYENAEFANEIILKSCVKESIKRDQVVLHSDNGSPMKASTWLATLRQLGITPSYSRPSVSNDNPYSESLFKTLKYSHLYPRKPFASIAKAIVWVDHFVEWYNKSHLHSGLNFVTPNDRHTGMDKIIIQNRINLYQKAKHQNPKRWTKGIRNWELPVEVHLNPSRPPRTCDLNSI